MPPKQKYLTSDEIGAAVAITPTADKREREEHAQKTTSPTTKSPDAKRKTLSVTVSETPTVRLTFMKH